MVQFTADSAEIANKAIDEMTQRCKQAQQEPGCLQFEVFRSAMRPEAYALLELWDSKEALAKHAQRNAANPRPPTPGIESGREDYGYQPT